jgi:hypothetical protein
MSRCCPFACARAFEFARRAVDLHDGGRGEGAKPHNRRGWRPSRAEKCRLATKRRRPVRFDTDAVRDRSGGERRSPFVEDLAARLYGFRRGGARLP